ncbi:MAG TPA: STAS domain-containing protein [Gammaproteobacteria bacterium]|nr:STAS domain-containing protein [Gammaproteobacteria bacterium]HRP86690.1 STAS domain-containing protein [Gammaproteobacteria bacterium]
MFDIQSRGEGRIVISGRLDASQARRAQEFIDGIENPREFDLARLEYISSAGLGILLRTQKRVMSQGGALRLVNVGNHIRDVFRYSGFDKIFVIEPSPGAD